MVFEFQRDVDSFEPAAGAAAHPTCGSLLVVEPDALLRWSLVTYFRNWFNVFAVATTGAGNEVIQEETINALVVSDELDLAAAQRMERLAYDHNPAVCIVRVVTSARSAADDPYAAGMLEKPFELAELASLLHIPAA